MTSFTSNGFFKMASIFCALVASILSLTSMAYADGAAPQQPATWEMLVMPIGFLVIMYFFMIRPQQKRAKEHQEFLSSIKVGDEVITTGGIIGRVKTVNEGFFGVEIASDTVVKVIKTEIARPSQKASQAVKTPSPAKA